MLKKFLVLVISIVSISCTCNIRNTECTNRRKKILARRFCRQHYYKDRNRVRRLLYSERKEIAEGILILSDIECPLELKIAAIDIIRKN